MKNKKLYITIDTEMDANVHWLKSWPPEYSSIYEGITKRLRPIWDKYDAHPVYLLSPEILYDEKCCSVFLDEIAHGAIIGAHLHPEYIEPMMSVKEGIQVERAQFPCIDCDTELERAKLKNLTELIEEKLGVKPEWYRAARFGADKDTYAILEELGYLHETSVTPGIDWSNKEGLDFSKMNIGSYVIENTKLIEHPVTILGKRLGILGRFLPENWLFYRWLRPTHMTYFEMRKMISGLRKSNVDELVMMFHSMEVEINKTPYVRCRWMQKYYLWRLDKVLCYAKKCGYEL